MKTSKQLKTNKDKWEHKVEHISRYICEEKGEDPEQEVTSVSTGAKIPRWRTYYNKAEAYLYHRVWKKFYGGFW